MILLYYHVAFMVYKKMLDVCSQYGVQFDIRFNSLKSQTSTFGGRHPSHIPFKLNGSVIPVTEKVKYLGVYINSLTNCFDPSVAIRKFFASFNNIIYVIGHSRDETVAVHLVKNFLFADSVVWM